jgi:hypothetical protein
MSIVELSRQFETENRLPDPHSAKTRGVDLMAQELEVFGYVTPELWDMIQDEEDTFAAELLPSQEMTYATVPREFQLKKGELVDIHGQYLNDVLKGGVESVEQQLKQGVPGADWELRRREAELNNLKKLMTMPAGMACIEISASPFDKPKHEQEAQNYTNLTMIRASFKHSAAKVNQYNYVLPVSSREFLKAVQAKLGRQPGDFILNSEELLENPIIQEVNEPAELAAKNLDSLIGAALLEAAVGQSAVQMIRQAIENRREAWQFITSANNLDLHQELRVAMHEAASLPQTERLRAMDAIRSGFWKELKDRFVGHQITIQEGGIIMAAASRAVADGDVFIACGTSTTATEFVTNNVASMVGRTEIVKKLRENVTGSGSCSACGAKGKLYGCNLCSGCNKKWCDIYERTGKQTEIKELAYQNYSRPQSSIFNFKSESLAEYWQRINREIEIKRQAKVARETDSKLEQARIGLW